MARELRPDMIISDVELSSAVDGVAAATYTYKALGIRTIFMTSCDIGSVIGRAKDAQPFACLDKFATDLELQCAVESYRDMLNDAAPLVQGNTRDA